MQDYCPAPWDILEVLNREATLLNDERTSLVDIEKKLLFMINEKIEAKIRNNEKLRLEIDRQKMTCAKLARILNSSIKCDLTINNALSQRSFFI